MTKLQKLAITMVPLAFIACQDPLNNTNANSGTTQTQTQTPAQLQAEEHINSFQNWCAGVQNGWEHASVQAFTEFINDNRDTIKKVLAENPHFTYTPSELNGYYTRLDKIASDTISAFTRNKNSARALDTLDK